MISIIVTFIGGVAWGRLTHRCSIFEKSLRERIYDDIMEVEATYRGLVAPWANGLQQAAYIARDGKLDEEDL